MKILLVDDEKDIHRSIGDFIGDMGHEVVSAFNGQEALKCLSEQRDIGLVFTDIRMPVDLDGLKLLKATRVRFPGIPVVLMTGHGDESVAIAALQNGAYEYLKKPVRLKELLAFIERARQRNSLEERLVRESRLLADRQRPDPTPLQQVQRLQQSLQQRLQSLQADAPTNGPLADQLASILSEIQELTQIATAAIRTAPPMPPTASENPNA